MSEQKEKTDLVSALRRQADEIATGSTLHRQCEEGIVYVEGMAPRVDKLDAFLSGESPRYQYIVMRAYARGLEIDLRELRQT